MTKLRTERLKEIEDGLNRPLGAGGPIARELFSHIAALDAEIAELKSDINWPGLLDNQVFINGELSKERKQLKEENEKLRTGLRSAVDHAHVFYKEVIKLFPAGGEI